MMSGGTGMSTYAASATVQIERRMVPGETRDQVVGEIQRLIDRLAAEDSSFSASLTTGLTREPFDSKQFVRSNDPKRPETIAVLKLNQVLHVPTGLSVLQQMHTSFWRVDDARFWKFSLTSSDSVGNTYKEARRTGDQFAYEFRTYWDGIADGKENIVLPAGGIFYDELPLRVRLIDFSRPNGEFEIQLAPTIINAKKDNIAFKAAKISFTSTARAIDVSLRSDSGTDRFILDRDFPFLLREWTAADGSHLKLKRSLKVAYENYTKAGDRERALADPMLRHPD
jgi:hypothetical protein